MHPANAHHPYFIVFCFSRTYTKLTARALHTFRQPRVFLIIQAFVDLKHAVFLSKNMHTARLIRTRARTHMRACARTLRRTHRSTQARGSAPDSPRCCRQPSLAVAPVDSLPSAMPGSPKSGRSLASLFGMDRVFLDILGDLNPTAC